MKGDSILFSIPQNLGPIFRFLRAPDNTFWGCAQQGLIRYSTKYALPPEITGGVAMHQHSQSSQNSLHVVDQGIVLQTQQAQMFRVLDLRGRLLWQGSVLGEQRVALPSGTWIVSAVGFQKLVFVP